MATILDQHSTSSPTPSSGCFQCSLCSKTFERRDLRNRHKRRCLKSFSQPRKSKRKACRSCATSKLSCDNDVPSCARCLSRGIVCEYFDIGGSKTHTLTSEDDNATNFITEASQDDAETYLAGHNIDFEPVEDICLQDLALDIFPRDDFSQSLSPMTDHLTSESPQIQNLATVRQSLLPSALTIPNTSLQAYIPIIQSYQRQMLKRGQYPPFVHHAIYACATGDVLEPLATAFCCVNAYNASLPSSRKFAENILNTEWDRLVCEFPQDGDALDMLGCVHAMCIYQIIGLFDGDKGMRRTAELKQGFLVKMTKKIAERHLIDLRTFHGGYDTAAWRGPTTWKTWYLHETIRRTIFFVNVINVLINCATASNQWFQEKFDREWLFQMPLPSSDALWQAKDEHQWLIEQFSCGSCVGTLNSFGHSSSSLEAPFEFMNMIMTTAAYMN